MFNSRQTLFSRKYDPVFLRPKYSLGLFNFNLIFLLIYNIGNFVNKSNELENETKYNVKNPWRPPVNYKFLFLNITKKKNSGVMWAWNL